MSSSCSGCHSPPITADWTAFGIDSSSTANRQASAFASGVGRSARAVAA